MIASKAAGSNGNRIDAVTSDKQRQADSSTASFSCLMSRLPLESSPTLGDGSVSLVYSPRKAPHKHVQRPVSVDSRFI